MKLPLILLLTSLVSVSAFADKLPCTVSIGGEYTSQWVVDQTKSELSALGCTMVEPGQQEKYSINYGFIYMLCSEPTRAQAMEWDVINSTIGATNFEGTLKNVQTGKTMDSVQKTFWTPEFSHNCNLFNKFSDRGAAKILQRFVKEIRTAEQAE